MIWQRLHFKVSPHAERTLVYSLIAFALTGLPACSQPRNINSMKGPQNPIISGTTSVPPNNEKTSSSDQDGTVADNQSNATMKMDEVFRSAGEEYSGNPPAFNARFENTRAEGEVTFQFLMGPDENGYYTMMFSEYNAPCAFSSSHYDALAKLRTGDKVFISGNPYMFGPGVVMLGDCKIIRM